VNGAPSTLVSPGLWGFAAFFVLAIALYLLMRNMNARMRRMSYRSEELQREAEAEAAGRRERTDQGARPTAADGSPQTGDGGEPEGQTGETH
jgi:type II secretory pathway pseudopilin PulG